MKVIWILICVGVCVFVGQKILEAQGKKQSNEEVTHMNEMMNEDLEKATFAGGCFWCMQPPFDKLKGVVSTVVGYTGGREKNPTYTDVAHGKTGHTEAIQIIFDPKIVSYGDLLQVFWMNIDPTTENRQFADVGTQYRSGIFYHDEQQRVVAEDSKRQLSDSKKFKKPIVTSITSASEFYRAEEYHQKYYEKNYTHYKAYRVGSGREGYLKKVWGK